MSVPTRRPEHTVLGEIQALEYAIRCVDQFTATSDSEALRSVTMYSDVEHIQRLLESKPHKLRPPVSKGVQDVKKRMKQFCGTHSDVRLHIYFLGNTAQRTNLYYKAAHKVARILSWASLGQ